MAEKKRSKKKKAAKRERRERRFVPVQTHTSWLAAGVGMIGALVLGAGVYLQWIREEALSYAPYLVAIGAAALGGGLVIGSAGVFPVRVGDAGVAIERGPDIQRIPWWEIERIALDKGNLLVRAYRMSLRIPLGAHTAATGVIVEEASNRIPDVVDISSGDRKRFREVKESEGERVPVEGVQVAGSRCAETKKLISFERDARLCQNCAQTYHREHVPKKCVTCGAELTGHTVSV